MSGDHELPCGIECFSFVVFRFCCCSVASPPPRRCAMATQTPRWHWRRTHGHAGWLIATPRHSQCGLAVDFPLAAVDRKESSEWESYRWPARGGNKLGHGVWGMSLGGRVTVRDAPTISTICDDRVLCAACSFHVCVCVSGGGEGGKEGVRGEGGGDGSVVSLVSV